MIFYLFKNFLGQLFVKFTNSNSRVITYINAKLISLKFLLRKNIFNH